MMLCVPLPTMAAATTRIKQHTNTGPIPTPTYANNTMNTTHRNGANPSVTTHIQVKTTPTSESTSNSLPQWMIGGLASTLSIAVLAFFIVMTGVGIKVAYTFQRRKKAKSVTGMDHIAKISDTKIIHVLKDETESQRQVMLTRRQHRCSKVSSHYDRIHDAGSPEPEVVVMVETDCEETCDEDRYTSMPYEHQMCSHHNVNDSPNYKDNTHSTSPVYDSIDSRPFYDSITPQDFPTPSGMEKTIQKTSISTSVSDPSTINMRYMSKSQDSGSSFQYPLTEGAVYSTRTTTSSSVTHPYPTSPTHSQTKRGSLTSSGSHRISGTGQRLNSRVSHRLSTTGGSTISSSRTATSTVSTRGSMNSMATQYN